MFKLWIVENKCTLFYDFQLRQIEIEKQIWSSTDFSRVTKFPMKISNMEKFHVWIHFVPVISLFTHLFDKLIAFIVCNYVCADWNFSFHYADDIDIVIYEWVPEAFVQFSSVIVEWKLAWSNHVWKWKIAENGSRKNILFIFLRIFYYIFEQCPYLFKSSWFFSSSHL